MNRWQALVEIVRSFNEHGSTGFGCLTTCFGLLTFSIPVVAAVVLAVMK